MIRSILLYLSILALLPQLAAQEQIIIYSVGNLTDVNGDLILHSFSNQIKSEIKSETYFLGLGDYTSPDKKSFQTSNHFNFLKDWKKSAKKSYLLSGDRDWDNNGPLGLKNIKALDDYLQNDLSFDKGLVFDEGCPGPEVRELSSYCTLILINSQWFIHPFDKPISTDNDCDLFNEEDFWEELEDAIEDAADKRIIIASHHNIYGNGEFSGEKRYPERWYLPIIGNFIADYKKNVGRPQDFAFRPYAAFRERMKDLLANYTNILYVSGHERTNEILQHGNNFFLNAGSTGKVVKAKKKEEQLYVGTEKVFSKIYVFPDNGIIIENIDEKGSGQKISIPWISTQPLEQKKIIIKSDVSEYVAGPEYAASGFKKFWMGEHYRKEWTTPIKAPKLWLDSLHGGLSPYAKGGGLQTASLKFKDKIGRKFAFRSINKNPERALDKDIRQTIYRHLVKDLITTQHPYGSLAASALLDKTDILHVNPKLYFLPDQTSLGEFREEFAGTLGTLELRPDKDDDLTFAGADDIVSTHQMYRELINDDDHVVDKDSYAKARAFDMWMGDWDRHQDNWKWAKYDLNGINTYRPIPRDRDHVFSQWEGIIPSIADWVIPNAEHFGKNFGNIRQLNWKARHLDRFVGNELDLEDWLKATSDLQNSIDSVDIREAINVMPAEIVAISGEEIENKLRSRLDQLDEAVTDNYRLLAKEVNIIGSNKKDDFEISSDLNGGLQIRIFDGHKVTYSRVFDPEYTDKVYIYGLGKKDNFSLYFPFESDIKVKIIGGKGSDKIIDRFPDIKKNVKVYDFRSEDLLSGEYLQRVKSHQDPVFNVNEFEYPAILPFLGFKSSSGNGLGIQATLSIKKKIFNKPDYGRITDIDAIYYPTWKAYIVDIDHRYRYFWNKQDLISNFTFSSYYSRYPFFYGIGNNTIRDNELYEDGYYRIEYNTLKTKFGFRKSIWQQSHLDYYGIFEYNNVDQLPHKTTYLGSLETPVFGLGKVLYAGLGFDMNIDMRNSQLFTRHGSLFQLSLKTFKSSVSTFANFHAHIAKYATYQLFSPTTFIVASGMYHTIGEAPFYYQSALGSNTNLRGHVRNRFVDKSAFYYNTELRLHLGTVRTVLAPIRYGAFVFHDNGKVFNGSFTLKEGMHPTYGLGVYFAPVSDQYSFSFTVANSDDRDTYFRMDFGWVL